MPEWLHGLESTCGNQQRMHNIALFGQSWKVVKYLTRFEMKRTLLTVIALFVLCFAIGIATRTIVTASAQEQRSAVSERYVDCVVESKQKDLYRVVCKDDVKNVEVAFGVFEADMPDPWMWRTQADPTNPDIPLKYGLPVVGQKLRAVMVDGEPLATPSCAVRVWVKVREWRDNHPGINYSKMPLGLGTAPDDCQPWKYTPEVKHQ